MVYSNVALTLVAILSSWCPITGSPGCPSPVYCAAEGGLFALCILFPMVNPPSLGLSHATLTACSLHWQSCSVRCGLQWVLHIEWHTVPDRQVPGGSGRPIGSSWGAVGPVPGLWSLHPSRLKFSLQKAGVLTLPGHFAGCEVLKCGPGYSGP
jgi:hypothetical protein